MRTDNQLSSCIFTTTTTIVHFPSTCEDSLCEELGRARGLAFVSCAVSYRDTTASLLMFFVISSIR